jgi:glyoxylase I family protein
MLSRRLIADLPPAYPGGYARFVERVTGIGGFFFRARDPGPLAIWYQERLGVKTVPETYEDGAWRQEAGETVFAPFQQDSEMIGPPEHTWMINFRVDDLDAMVAKLRDAGIEVEPHAEEYPNGRFAELADPEGNAIQLWEPNAASVARDPGPP